MDPQLKRFYMMAKSGVPLHGIMTQMNLAGFTAETVDGFKLWYLETTQQDESAALDGSKAALSEVERRQAFAAPKNLTLTAERNSSLAPTALRPPRRFQQDQIQDSMQEQDQDLTVEPMEVLHAVRDFLQSPTKAERTMEEHPGKEGLSLIATEQGVDPLAVFEAVQFVEKFSSQSARSGSDYRSTLARKTFAKVPTSLLSTLAFDRFGLHSSQEEHETVSENDFASFFNLVQGEFSSETVDLLAKALYFRQQLLDRMEQVSDQVNLALEFLGRLGDGSKEKSCLLPLGYTGPKNKGFFTLLVTAEGKTFTLRICSKDNAEYHPQRVDENGRMEIVPILCLRNVKRARLLNPTFMSMLVKLQHQPSKFNNSRVLYEVLLPYLADGKPLHLAMASQYEGQLVAGAWWTHPSISSCKSPFSSLLVALRHLDGFTADEWRRAKLGLRTNLFQDALAMSFPASHWDAMAVRLASSAVKVGESDKTIAAPIDLVQALQEKQRDAMDMELVRARFTLVGSTMSCRDVPPKYLLEAYCASSVAKDALTLLGGDLSRSIQSSRDFINPSNPFFSGEGGLASEIDGLHSIVTYLRTQESSSESRVTILSTIHSAFTHHLPQDPKIWQSSKEWKSLEVQEQALYQLLQIAVAYFDAYVGARTTLHKVGHHTVEGNRLIIFGALFAFSNAILLNSSGDHLDQCFPNFTSLSGEDFNVLSAKVASDPDLGTLRSNILPFICGRVNEGRSLWDFSEFQSKLSLSIPATLQIAGKLLGSKGTSIASYANDFCKQIDVEFPSFAHTRDLALLAKYGCQFLSEESVRLPIDFSTPVKWEYLENPDVEEVEIFASIAKEEVFHNFLSRNQKIPRETSPKVCLQEGGLISVVSDDADEHDVLCFSSLRSFSGFMSSAETERFATFLTVPFVRIPLMLNFFVEENRLSLLFNSSIRRVFIASLLEPCELELEPEVVHEHLKSSNLRCPQKAKACKVLPEYKSQLLYEFREPESMVMHLFLKLISGLVDICENTATVPQGMMEAVLDFAVVLAKVEDQVVHQKDCAKIENLLRQKLLSFFEKKGLFGACTVCYLSAPVSTIESRSVEIACWSLRNISLKGSIDLERYVRDAVQLFLSRHAKVLLVKQIPSQILHDLVFSTIGRPLATSATWELDGFVYRCGSMSLNVFTGNLQIEGSFKLQKLPPGFYKGKDGLLSSIIGPQDQMACPAFLVAADELQRVSAETISSSVELFNVAGDKLQLSMLKEPNFERKTNNLAEVDQSVHGEEYVLFETIEGFAVPVPISSTEEGKSHFSSLLEPEETVPHFSAALRLQSSGESLCMLPTALLRAYLPAAFLERGYIFWLNTQSGIVKATMKFKHDETLEFEDFSFDLNSGSIYRPLSKLELDTSPPATFVNSFCRVDDARYVLFWKTLSGALSLIEFARLGLHFVIRGDRPCFSENLSLEFDPELDDELARSNAPALKGLNRFIVLTNQWEEEYVLCTFPSLNALTTAVVKLDPTRSFLQPASRVAALSLFLSKLESCAYGEALDLLSYVATDEPFSETERDQISRLTNASLQLPHPDATAVRIQFYAATFLRNGHTFPEKSSLFNDASLYILCESLVEPRLRIPQAHANFIMSAALRQGRPKPKIHRMALSTLEDGADFATDHKVQLLEAYMMRIESSRTSFPVCIPNHGGGGWHRIQATAFDWAEKGVEDPEEWIKTSRLPLIGNSNGIQLDGSDARDPAKFCEKLDLVLEGGSVDAVFRSLYAIVTSPTSSGLGLDMAYLVTTRLYLHCQNVQGTPFFEKGSFFLLAMLLRGYLHVREIPFLIPQAVCSFGEISNFCYKLAKFLLKTFRPVTSAIKISYISECFVPRERSATAVSYFSPPCTCDLPSPTTAQPPLLSDSPYFSMLLCSRNVEKQKIKKKSTKNQDFLKELAENSKMLTNVTQRKDALRRLKESLSQNEKREVMIGNTASWLIEDERVWKKALDALRIELRQDKQALQDALVSIKLKALSAFDFMSTSSRRAPVFGLRDLLKLFVSEEGRLVGDAVHLPFTEIRDLLHVGVCLQLKRSLYKALVELQEADEDDRLPLSELVIELMTKQRYHDDDPCYLVFEFQRGFLLRQNQIELLYSLRESSASCRQMQMGGGKSSTILPLFGLFWASSKQVRQNHTSTMLLVPQSLVAMSTRMITDALAGVFENRVVHFQFSRYSAFEERDDKVSELELLATRLEFERRCGSIIVSTGSSLKAFLLKTVEQVTPGDGGQLAHDLQRILGILRNSNVLLDECDVLLHPLRSELNFPFGPKQNLAHSSWRIGLARAALGAVFKPNYEMQKVLQAGLDNGKLEKVPHVVLVDKSYYEGEMKPILAKDLARHVYNEARSKDFSLKRVREFSGITSDSCLDENHLPSNVSFVDEKFWCSAEYPKETYLQIKLPSPEKVGAVEIRFRQYSSFVGRSGASMVPSQVSIQVSRSAKGPFQTVASVRSFKDRRIYIDSDGMDLSTYIRIQMEGNARWFAVNHLEIFSEEPREESRGRKKKVSRFFFWKSKSPREDPTILDDRDCAATLEAAILARTRGDRLATLLAASGLHQGCGSLVEMASDYLHTFIPHCLQKVHSVSHGLIQTSAPSESVVRRYMSVPFIGKDTPSKASEYSHPDILILLTLSAFHFGGLRKSDVQELVQSLKHTLTYEHGSFSDRPSWLAFDEVIKTSTGMGEPVLPLHLFDKNDSRQIDNLWKQVKHSQVAVDEFCDRIVFPKCLRHRTEKLSATGEELVYPFGGVHGFSGTPNSALPLKLGDCIWEKGTEGRFVNTLTSPKEVKGLCVLEKDWDPSSFLHAVATHPNQFCALIDVGALVTGFTNREAANYLLMIPNGLEGKSGVVYIADSGEKRIVLRSEESGGVARDIALDSCSLPPSKRFTYYDQMHTTGMDILQPSSGIAAISVGKDVNFRDFAQGAYRMRRLGVGQTLSVFAPNPVMELARGTLSTTGRKNMSELQQLVAFLYLKGLKDLEGMKEALRVVQPQSIWREGALNVVESPPRDKSRIDDLLLARESFQSKITFDENEMEEVRDVKENFALFNRFVSSPGKKAQLKGLIAQQSGSVRLFSKEASRNHGLDSEQQQEREQEQESENMDELEDTQARSWSGVKSDTQIWELTADVTQQYVTQQSEAFYELRDLEIDMGSSSLCLEFSPQVPIILFSTNHTPRLVGAQTRIKNVEICVKCSDGAFLVVDLEEAGTIRWAEQFQPSSFRSLFAVESQLNLCGGVEANISEQDCMSFQLLRFINSSPTFTPEQIGLLDKAFQGTPGTELEALYMFLLKIRRRDHEVGDSTADSVRTLTSLFSNL